LLGNPGRVKRWLEGVKEEVAEIRVGADLVGVRVGRKEKAQITGYVGWGMHK